MYTVVLHALAVKLPSLVFFPRDDQRLRWLRMRVRKIFERKTAAQRDGAFRGVSTNFLNKASLVLAETRPAQWVTLHNI